MQHKTSFFESPASGDDDRHIMIAKTVEISLSAIPEIYGHIHNALFVCRTHFKYFRQIFGMFSFLCFPKTVQFLCLFVLSVCCV